MANLNLMAGSTDGKIYRIQENRFEYEERKAPTDLERKSESRSIGQRAYLVSFRETE
jgi:hypothetical protein